MSLPCSKHQWEVTNFSSNGEPLRRACTFCGTVEYVGGPARDLSFPRPDKPPYPTNHGPHDWRLMGLDPNGMYHRECRLCRFEEVSRDRSFSEASGTHQHIWNYYGATKRVCDVCGEVHAPGPVGWEKVSRGGYIQDEKKGVTSVAGKELEVSGNSVASLGGIVAYSPGMKKVQFGDGSEVTTGVLLSSNPGVNSIALLSSLEDLPSRFYTPQQLADRIQAAAASMSASETSRAIQRWQDAMKRMSQAATSTSAITTMLRADQPLLSTDDAMTLIVETVRNAGSPEETRKLASQWLTRFTKEVSDILRELDRENE